METISLSVMGRYFGLPTAIKISDTHIVIDAQGKITCLTWQELTVPPLFHLSFFGQILSLKTETQHYAFTMLAYRSKYRHKSLCEQYWAIANISRVNTLLTAIEQFKTSRYIRRSTIERIQLAAKQELMRWSPWLKLAKKTEPWGGIIEKIQRLSGYQSWNDQDITDCREYFINQQLNKHKNYFDRVESNPLTQRQRRACIIDNDNNLLLAGAGTGKTSVMVGRVGYLLNSEQAKNTDILLLAYGRKAAEEMDERIKDKLVTEAINTKTFHSLGLHIITQVEGKTPNLSVFSSDEQKKSAWIAQTLTALIKRDEQYRDRIIEYFSQHYYIERSVFDFKSKGEYYQYLTDHNVRSFQGERVKSFGELVIANQLFFYGIDYKYKAKYAYDVKTPERKLYRPSFYLPKFDVYIEYDESMAAEVNNKSVHSKPAKDFEKEQAQHQWRRDIHTRFNTLCLEFTYTEHQAGQLKATLIEALIDLQNQTGLAITQTKSHSKAITRLAPEIIIEALIERGKIIELAKNFTQLIALYKAAFIAVNPDPIIQTESQIELQNTIIANSAAPKQTEKLLALFKPVFIAYENKLQEFVEIDFEDMINKALFYVQTEQFKSPWRYIMVDEFQDISEKRARLIKALRDNNKACSLFSVGDDWQAIYRFSGADVMLTTKFSDYFGSTTQSELDKTFRFNDKISQVSSRFVSKNPAQINKIITSIKQVDMPAISLLQRENSSINVSKAKQVNEIENGAVDDVLSAISVRVSKPATVYILARFWFLLPDNTEVKRLNNKYPLLAIETQTFHASKGKEADFVIILGMNKGVHGCPSEKIIPALNDALLAKQESFPYAEERRLFYVALTRAKKRVYLIAEVKKASLFVKELMCDHQIEENEFASPANQLFINDSPCLACGTGVLQKHSGQYGHFIGCSHFPYCEYKERC